MIKSRLNTPASWIIIIGTFLFLVVSLISIYGFYSGSSILSYHSFSTKVYLGLSIPGLVLFIWIASSFLKQFSIDNYNKSIESQNVITRKKIIYNFFELDGYYDTAVNHGGTVRMYYKTIAMIKNKEQVVVIDSYYISNIS